MSNILSVADDAMLDVKELRKSFAKHEILKGIDFTIKRGEKVVVIGPSGSGKSTFLRCLNYLERPTSGSVKIMGQLFELPNQKYNEKYVASLRQEIGMVFQRFNLFPHLTVRENLVAPLVTIRKLTKGMANENAEKYLKKVGLTDRIDHYPSQLSGGQQQRVAIARALAMEPKIMLFDEATSALDPELVGEVLSVIRELANEGMTMILVTHEMEFAKDVGDRIIFMDGGLIVEEGRPAEIFTNPRNKRTADFVKKVIH